MGPIAILIGVGGLRVQDPFVLDQLVVFGLGSHLQGILLGISMDGMRLGHWGDAQLGLGMFQLVLGILVQGFIVQLSLAFRVEGKAWDFALHVTLVSHVTVVFGSPRTKLHDWSPGSNSLVKSPRKSLSGGWYESVGRCRNMIKSVSE